MEEELLANIAKAIDHYKKASADTKFKDVCKIIIQYKSVVEANCREFLGRNDPSKLDLFAGLAKRNFSRFAQEFDEKRLAYAKTTALSTREVLVKAAELVDKHKNGANAAPAIRVVDAPPVDGGNEESDSPWSSSLKRKRPLEHWVSMQEQQQQQQQPQVGPKETPQQGEEEERPKKRLQTEKPRVRFELADTGQVGESGASRSAESPTRDDGDAADAKGSSSDDDTDGEDDGVSFSDSEVDDDDGDVDMSTEEEEEDGDSARPTIPTDAALEGIFGFGPRVGRRPKDDDMASRSRQTWDSKEDKLLIRIVRHYNPPRSSSHPFWKEVGVPGRSPHACVNRLQVLSNQGRV